MVWSFHSERRVWESWKSWLTRQICSWCLVWSSSSSCSPPQGSRCARASCAGVPGEDCWGGCTGCSPSTGQPPSAAWCRAARTWAVLTSSCNIITPVLASQSHGAGISKSNVKNWNISFWNDYEGTFANTNIFFLRKKDNNRNELERCSHAFNYRARCI